MKENRVLTTEEACKRLGMSRATFYARVKEHSIKPANYNPNLKRQADPRWRLDDVDKVGIPQHPEVIGEPLDTVA